MVGLWYRQKLHGTRETSNGERMRVRIIHGLNISQKNSYTYCKNLEAIKKFKYYAHAPREIDWQEKTIAHPRPPLIRMHKPGTLHVSNLLHNFTHTCMLWDLQTSTQVFLKFTIINQHDFDIITSITQNNYQAPNLSLVFNLLKRKFHMSRTLSILILNELPCY